MHGSGSGVRHVISPVRRSKRSLRLCLRLRLCVCVVFLLCCRLSVSFSVQRVAGRSASDERMSMHEPSGHRALAFVRRERHRRRCTVIERLHTESLGSNCAVGLDECASKRSLRLCLRLRLSVSEQNE